MTERKDPVLAWGEWGTVYRDGTFINSAGTFFTKSEMDDIKKSYMNTDRMHKPYMVTFYTDTMNGKNRKEWKDSGLKPASFLTQP